MPDTSFMGTNTGEENSPIAEDIDHDPTLVDGIEPNHDEITAWWVETAEHYEACPLGDPHCFLCRKFGRFVDGGTLGRRIRKADALRLVAAYREEIYVSERNNGEHATHSPEERRCPK